MKNPRPRFWIEYIENMILCIESLNIQYVHLKTSKKKREYSAWVEKQYSYKKEKCYRLCNLDHFLLG